KKEDSSRLHLTGKYFTNSPRADSNSSYFLPSAATPMMISGCALKRHSTTCQQASRNVSIEVSRCCAIDSICCCTRGSKVRIKCCGVKPVSVATSYSQGSFNEARVDKSC